MECASSSTNLYSKECNHSSETSSTILEIFLIIYAWHVFQTCICPYKDKPNLKIM